MQFTNESVNFSDEQGKILNMDNKLNERHKNCNYIACDKCDTCQKHSTGVMMHDDRGAYLFGCKDCYPNVYERQASADKDCWLRGS